MSRTFRDPSKFAYDAHKGYWAHHNSLGAEVAIKDERGVSPLDTATGRTGIRDNHPSPAVAKILQTALGQ